MCKVASCKEQHDKHYCKLCKNEDSEHFSHDCPQIHTLYYGTTIEIAKKIKGHGFRTSKKGSDHQGVYMSKHMEQAVRYSQKRFKEKQFVILECQVFDKDLSYNGPVAPKVPPGQPNPNLAVNEKDGGDLKNQNKKSNPFVKDPNAIKVTASFKIKE